MESYLPVIWAAIIGCAVAMYVILDGFDLGVGILFPFDCHIFILLRNLFELDD